MFKLLSRIMSQSYNYENNKNNEYNQNNEDKKVNDDIKKMLSQKCGNSHTQCKAINNKIIAVIDANRQLDNSILDDYIDYLQKSGGGYYYYGEGKCIKQTENYINSLSLLIAFRAPSYLSMQYLIASDNQDAFNKIIHYEYDIDPNIFIEALESKKVHVCESLSKYNKINVTVGHLNRAIENGLETIVANILSRNVVPTNETLVSAIKKKSLAMVKTIITMGVAPQQEHLEEACLVCSEDIIKFFLELKMFPTKQCFKNVIDGLKNLKYYDWKGRVVGRYYDNDGGSKPEPGKVIDLLTAYGYIPDYEDVLLATQAQVKINNFESFNITLDEKYFEMCAEKNFHPYSVKNVMQTPKMLEIACKQSGNLSNIKKLVNDGIKPTAACLVASCKFKSNIQTLKFLVSKGAPVTIEAIDTLANTIGNRSLQYLMAEYKTSNGSKETKNKKNDSASDEDTDDQNDKNDQNNQDHQDDQDDQDDENDKDEDNDSDEDEEIKDDNSNDNKEDELVDYENDYVIPDNKLVVDKIADSILKNIEDDDSIEEIKQKKPVENKAKKGKIIVVSRKKKSENTTSEIENKTEIKSENKVEIPEVKEKYPLVKLTPSTEEIKPRQTITLGAKLCKLILGKDGPKATTPVKMTYNQLKQNLMSYFNKKDLFDKENKMMVLINDELSEVSGCQKDKYLNFMDFEDFVNVVFTTNK